MGGKTDLVEGGTSPTTWGLGSFPEDELTSFWGQCFWLLTLNHGKAYH